MDNPDPTAYKPEDYPSVSPYLVVPGAQDLIDFLKAVFGATELRRYDAADNLILHAELRIDDSVVMLADASPRSPALVTTLHVYVPDVNATYSAALRAGASSLQEPKVQPGDPDERGGFKDRFGNSWWVSTQE